MSLTHITSQSIRRLLTLTEKKEQLIKGIEDVENMACILLNENTET